MANRHEENVQKQERTVLVRKQARRDFVCAEYLALQASTAIMGGGAAFIDTQLEDDEDDFRPY